MKSLLIRDLTDEQIQMFVELAGLKLVKVFQANTLIDLVVTTALENLVVMELEP